MIELDKEVIRGELADDLLFDAIDWKRLNWYCQEVVLAQASEVRTAILDTDERGPNDGPVVNVNLKPFDADGFLWVLWEGLPIIKLHVSRLLPGAPLALDDMQTR